MSTMVRTFSRAICASTAFGTLVIPPAGECATSGVVLNFALKMKVLSNVSVSWSLLGPTKICQLWL